MTTPIVETRRRALVVGELTVLAAVTFVLYGVLWTAQRALFLSAFANSPFGQTLPRPDAAASRADALTIEVVGLLACGAFLWLVLRSKTWMRARLSGVALGIPAVVAVGLFLLPPTLSDDVYSYLSHGYLAAVPGANPYVDPSSAVADTAYGHLLLEQGWTAAHPATPYGPVWTTLERTAYLLSGDDVVLGTLLMKLPALLSVAVIGLLLFRFLRRRTPENALRGCLLFVANPLVLVELAGDGHNDALLAALLLGAVLATADRRVFLAVALLGLAVLVKTSVLPFLVPIAVYLFVSRSSARRLVIEAVLGVVAVALIGIALVAPYWRGSATFSGLRDGGMLIGWSVSGALRHAALLVVAVTGVDEAAALQVAQAVLLLLLVAGTLVVSRRARTVDGLLLACGAVSLIVLLLLPIAWPWYATVLAALLPLVPDAVSIAVIAVIAVASRIAAPLADAAGASILGSISLYGTQTFITQTVPSVTGLAIEWAGRRRRGPRSGSRISEHPVHTER